MVIAYHVIFGAYGFWLPNDPRGSWSSFVWAEHLKRFGPPISPGTRRSVAGRAHDAAARLAAKQALLYPAVQFDSAARDAVAAGFAKAVGELGLEIVACAIMPDHVHLVVMRFDETIEWVTGYVKRAATRALGQVGVHPLAGNTDRRGRTPTPWAEGGWFVYLNNDGDIDRSVRYVRGNPAKAGMAEQRWGFVAPWP
jgi:REP element-mobilizing transposase RayT